MEDFNLPPALRRSVKLHERVQEFARAHSGAARESYPVGESFEELALDIARFQEAQSPGFARLVAARNGKLESLEDIPLIPSEAFRLTRVAAHPPEMDAAVYVTSGTTSALTGHHPVRDLKTKETLTLLQAQDTLFSRDSRGIVIALAEAPQGTCASSLTHMMQFFIRIFDGRPLTSDPEGAAFIENEAGRFLLNSQGVDLEGLRRAARLARHRSEPLFLLSTSFSLAATLELLEDEELQLPSRTYVMLTGGFKGHRSTLSEPELRSRTIEKLRLDPSRLIGEYGMTELTSQLFEVPETGAYEAPPWLRVRALDPATHEPVPEGQPGIAHFLDLGNVDSSISVLTQDLITTEGSLVRLQGRAPQAPARGCSLPYEQFLIRGKNG